MTPTPMTLIMLMFSLLIINLMTMKTSIMCINLVVYTTLSSLIMSMKMKLTPIPFIVFLTMIGGLMIIFLYLAATLWTKKETLTLKTKIMILSMILVPSLPHKMMSESPINDSMNLFNKNLNNITMILIILLTIMLVFTIEIHKKVNMPFRRKLKIWA